MTTPVNPDPTDEALDEKTAQTIVDRSKDRYASALADVVRHIRDMADRVEREGVPHATRGIAGTPRYANAVEAVLHALTWDTANMNAYRLVSAAAHADQAETAMRAIVRDRCEQTWEARS